GRLQPSDSSNRGDAAYPRVTFPTHVNTCSPFEETKMYFMLKIKDRFSLIKNSPTKGDQHAGSIAPGPPDYTSGHKEGWSGSSNQQMLSLPSRQGPGTEKADPGQFKRVPVRRKLFPFRASAE
ncbi:hypothetical protein P7K49_040280, partial [Saguinus oedipus]